MSNPDSPQVVYVDVDDTLVRSVGSTRIPMPSVVANACKLHSEAVILYLWSSGGAEYAGNSALGLGIVECFVAFLPQLNVYIDDQAVEDWRTCRHIYPGQV